MVPIHLHHPSPAPPVQSYRGPKRFLGVVAEVVHVLLVVSQLSELQVAVRYQELCVELGSSES